MAWFKRGDGVMFAADEGSASFNLMVGDGAFELSDAPTTESETELAIEAKTPTPKKTTAKKSATKKTAVKKTTVKKPDEKPDEKLPSDDAKTTE